MMTIDLEYMIVYPIKKEPFRPFLSDLPESERFSAFS